MDIAKQLGYDSAMDKSDIWVQPTASIMFLVAVALLSLVFIFFVIAAIANRKRRFNLILDLSIAAVLLAVIIAVASVGSATERSNSIYSLQNWLSDNYSVTVTDDEAGRLIDGDTIAGEFDGDEVGLVLSTSGRVFFDNGETALLIVNVPED